MKTFLITAAIMLCIVPLGFTRQDPDDPGLPDSLIVESVQIDSGTTFAFIRIYAVTDDSVAYYNMPLRWTAPGGGAFPGAGTQYFFPLTSWDLHFDSVLVTEGYIRQFGISDIGGEDNPILLTNGQRLNAWIIRFLINPNAPPQEVVIDTAWDSNNGSLVLGLYNGISEITPAFRRGYLNIMGNAVNDGPINPTIFSLSPNYPNPFNPATIIEFSIPRVSEVRLIVYNVLGQTVRVLLDDVKEPGTYFVVWDGADDNGSPQSSGTYLYNLTTSDNSESKRMALIR